MRTFTPTSYRRLSTRRKMVIIAAAILIAAVLGSFVSVWHLEAAPPLVDVSQARPRQKDASIVFLSGDTGLRSWSLGGRVAQRLAQAGYPVIGVDNLAAFSERRTPDQATQLLARAMEAALQRNPKAPLVLIGQSFGSDILTMTVPRLPPALRARISKLILVVPGTTAYLQVSPGEIAGITPPDVALTPLAGKLPDIPITCIYGVEEADSLCRVFNARNVAVVGMPGGHALHRDTDAVFAVVSRALRAPDSAHG